MSKDETGRIAPRLASSPTRTRQFRHDINGLRAIAVVAVVLFHVSLAPFGGGFVGVDIFFVISGFLMTRIILNGLERDDFSVALFWLDRARRIVPALLVACLAVGLVGWLIVEPIGYAVIGSHLLSSVLFVSNIKYWMEAGYFDARSETKWLLHTWSLSVEWQFYLCYPLVLAGARALGGSRAIRPLLWIGFTLSLASSVIVTDWRPSLAFFMLPTRAWEMIAGGLVLVHSGALHRLGERTHRGLELTALAMIAAAIVWFDLLTPWPSWRALLPVLGSALLIASARGDRSILNLAPIQAIGRWSYSIYLWHWPVIVLFRYEEWHGRAWGPWAEIGLALLLGYASYRWVEVPSQGWFRHMPRLRESIVLAAATLLLVIGGAGIATRQGFPARAAKPALMSDYAAAASDWYFPEERCTRAGPDRSIHVCRVSGAQSGGTLVVGDSHAEVWFARYAEPGTDRIVFVTRGGCPPYPTVLRLKQGIDCRGFFDEAMKVAADGKFERVLLIGRWTSWVTLNDAGQDETCTMMANACVSAAGNEAAFAKTFADLAERVRTLGMTARVSIVLPIPVPPVDLPRTLSRRDFSGVSTADLASISRSGFETENRKVRDALERVARDAGASLIDLVPAMCDASRCPLLLADGRPIFSDANHLRSSLVMNRYDFLDRYIRPRS